MQLCINTARVCFFNYSYDKEQVELDLDNQRHLIKLHDTAGQEDYERIRQVIYKEVRAIWMSKIWNSILNTFQLIFQANVFILCYSLDNRSSFENILSKWYPELKPFNVPIVLVGKLL